MSLSDCGLQGIANACSNTSLDTNLFQKVVEALWELFKRYIELGQVQGHVK
jgi:hypothetical protein